MLQAQLEKEEKFCDALYERPLDLHSDFIKEVLAGSRDDLGSLFKASVFNEHVKAVFRHQRDEHTKQKLARSVPLKTIRRRFSRRQTVSFFVFCFCFFLLIFVHFFRKPRSAPPLPIISTTPIPCAVLLAPPT